MKVKKKSIKDLDEENENVKEETKNSVENVNPNKKKLKKRKLVEDVNPNKSKKRDKKSIKDLDEENEIVKEETKDISRC